MFQKVEKLVEEYREIERKLGDNDYIKNQAEYTKLGRRHKELSKIVDLHGQLKRVLADLKDAEEILAHENDESLRDLAKDQLKEAKEKHIQLEEALKVELLPKDPDDLRNCIVEIRAGAGGEEAALFGGELARMY
ncbi:MAG TPA: PCRF domain-containing protein, partial [Candidatus Gracilibacteria bacterium]|nr:PCRF domain-containing protein [Candidatus Gracilibacteria bacterium]